MEIEFFRKIAKGFNALNTNLDDLLVAVGLDPSKDWERCGTHYITQDGEGFELNYVCEAVDGGASIWTIPAMGRTFTALNYWEVPALLVKLGFSLENSFVIWEDLEPSIEQQELNCLRWENI